MPKSAPSSPAPAASAAPQPSWPCATSSTAAYAPDHPTDMTRFALRAGKTLIPENPGEPVARPAARHGQPGHDRRHRKIRPRPGAIRTQDDQLKVAEKTSMHPSKA